MSKNAVLGERDQQGRSSKSPFVMHLCPSKKSLRHFSLLSVFNKCTYPNYNHISDKSK